MAGILSQKWHNKRSGWTFWPEAQISTFRLFNGTTKHPLYEIHKVLERAEEARPWMRRQGEDLAAHLGGTFTLAKNKTREQALISLALRDFDLHPSQLETSAHDLPDAVRGCILVDGVEGIEHARTKLRSILDYKQSVIVKVIDKCSRPAANEMRGIFIYLKDPNGGVIGEIQLHAREYWAAMNRERQKYEDYRTLSYENYLSVQEAKEAAEKEQAEQEARVERGEPEPTDSKPAYLTREWNDATNARLHRLKKERAQALRDLAVETGVLRLEQKDTEFKDDCSFPLRPAVDSKTGERGYIVPSYMQKELIRLWVIDAKKKQGTTLTIDYEN